MEKNKSVISALKKTIYCAGKNEVAWIVYRYWSRTNPSTGERNSVSRKFLTFEDLSEIFKRKGFDKDHQTYFDWSNKELEALIKLRSTVDNLEAYKEEIVAFIDDKDLNLDEEKATQLAFDEAQKDVIEKYLPGRSDSEKAIAREILTNNRDFKYKSDKVKAFLRGGLNEMEIERLMATNAETTVNQSYINSIKKQLNP